MRNMIELIYIYFILLREGIALAVDLLHGWVFLSPVQQVASPAHECERVGEYKCCKHL